MGDQTTGFSKTFEENVELLATTTVGNFDGKVAEGDFKGGEECYWEQLGGAAPVEVTEANGQQVYKQLEQYRRKKFTKDWELPLMLDKRHEMRSAVNLRSGYTARTVEAYKRSKEIEIFKGMYNVAYTGKNGVVATDFDYANQSLAVGLGAAAGNAGMNKTKLIKGRSMLKKAGWDLSSGRFKPYANMSQDQLDDLLALEEFTSRDYANLQALETGEKTSWLGLEFVLSETTPYYDATNGVVDLTWAETEKGILAPVDTDVANIRACCVYVKENIGYHEQAGFNARAGELERYRYNHGTYASWSNGSVRRQEDGIVFVPCDQTPA